MACARRQSSPLEALAHAGARRWSSRVVATARTGPRRVVVRATEQSNDVTYSNYPWDRLLIRALNRYIQPFDFIITRRTGFVSCRIYARSSPAVGTRRVRASKPRSSCFRFHPISSKSFVFLVLFVMICESRSSRLSFFPSLSPAPPRCPPSMLRPTRPPTCAAACPKFRAVSGPCRRCGTTTLSLSSVLPSSATNLQVSLTPKDGRQSSCRSDP